jgi:acyl carrier protein phosphodiesterase
MNYLAHAYLSFLHPQVLVGNMISDFVKGRARYSFEPLVQKGIQLHRDIDTFTDNHPATAAAKQFFKPVAGLYAGAFVDVVYDHFLALDTAELDEIGWRQFSAQTYTVLQAHLPVLPERFASMLPYMQQQDWLFNYRYHRAIQNSFAGLARRAVYLETSAPAFEAFETFYTELGQIYKEFFPFVKTFAFARLQELLLEP